jgi:hypothetical protein
MNIPALQEITSLFEREFDYGRAERVEVVTTGYLSTNWIIHTPKNIFFLNIILWNLLLIYILAC